MKIQILSHTTFWLKSHTCLVAAVSDTTGFLTAGSCSKKLSGGPTFWSHLIIFS